MKIEQAKEAIQRALLDQGTYMPSLDIAIHSAAVAYVIFTKAAKDVEELECLYLKVGPEGAEKIINHPALDLLYKSQAQMEKCLKALDIRADPMKAALAEYMGEGQD